MTDSTYEQTNYFCLAVKQPEEDFYRIEGAALRLNLDSLIVQKKILEEEESYKDHGVKIFHFKLVGEVE